MIVVLNMTDSLGHPICPMQDCFQPIRTGDSQAFTVTPEAIERLYDMGLLDQNDPDGIVFVHKDLSCQPIVSSSLAVIPTIEI